MLRHFSESEFVMDGVNVFEHMDAAFLSLLDECRHIAGVKMKINSCYRTKAKNKAVGGAQNSMHLFGRAVDIETNTGVARMKVVKAALSLGLTVGIMENAVHIDNRESQTLFHYYAKYKRK